MVMIVFGFRLEGGSAPATASVRIWVDADGNHQLDEGEEVRPLLQEGLQWFGSFQLAEGNVDGTTFVVHYSAAPGMRWSLDVALNGEPPRQLYSESDKVTAADGRIIGRLRL
jgi:hypothetical protein